MRIIFHIAFIFLLIVSCSAHAIVDSSKSQSKDTTTSPLSQKAQEPKTSNANMLKGLAYSFETTNYCALIKQEKLTYIAGYDEVDTYEVQADIIEIFKGTSTTQIKYEMRIESGEQLNLNPDTIVVCLCENNGHFLYPGVGSIFPNDESVLKHARNLAKTQPESNNNSCTEF